MSRSDDPKRSIRLLIDPRIKKVFQAHAMDIAPGRSINLLLERYLALGLAQDGVQLPQGYKLPRVHCGKVIKDEERVPEPSGQTA
jgi:hypothetical protein